MVALSLFQVLKTAALKELVSTLILQSNGYRYGSAALVRLIDDVTQDAAPDSAALMRGVDLKLTYFDGPGLIE